MRNKTMNIDSMTHAARKAMNHNPEIRTWIENYIKNKVRAEKSELSDQEFEYYWKYHKPEIIHERSLEGFLAYREHKTNK